MKRHFRKRFSKAESTDELPVLDKQKHKSLLYYHEINQISK